MFANLRIFHHNVMPVVIVNLLGRMISLIECQSGYTERNQAADVFDSWHMHLFRLDWGLRWRDICAVGISQNVNVFPPLFVCNLLASHSFSLLPDIGIFQVGGSHTSDAG